MLPRPGVLFLRTGIGIAGIIADGDVSFKQVAIHLTYGLDDYVRRCGDLGWEVCGIAAGKMASFTVVIRKEKTVHDIDPDFPSPYLQ